MTTRVRAVIARAKRKPGSLMSSWYGDCLPESDFPVLSDLDLHSGLPLDKFVSETIALQGVEQSFAKMRQGGVLRSVVLF